MALITMTKKELDDMGRLIREQDRVLKEQADFIAKQGFEGIVNRGFVIYQSQTLYALAIQYSNLILRNLTSVKIPEEAPKEERAAHENLLREAKKNLDRENEKLCGADKAWKTFTESYPEAAKVLIQRIGAGLQKEEVT